MKRKSKKKKIKQRLFLFLILSVLVAGLFLLLFIFNKSVLFFASRRIDSAVNEVLTKSGLDLSDIHRHYVQKRQGHREWEQVEVVVNLNHNISIADLSMRLQQALDSPAVSVVETRPFHENGYTQQVLSVHVQEMSVYKIVLKKKMISKPAKPPLKAKNHALPEEKEKKTASIKEGAPRIALIIDDVGYDVERARELMDLHQPMTMSIFPRLRNSRHIAEIAHQMGYEVMLHLPMEADEQLKHNPGLIMEGMSRNELFGVLDKDLDSIPYVSGVNNHQGSKMTKDRDTMALVMERLAEKKLYFIDSRTTRDSVAYAVAREYGLKTAENDFFLDNQKDPEYIKQRLLLLMNEARLKGTAIGICHVHPTTIQTLRQMIPFMEQEGIHLVYASQIAE